MKNYKKKVRGDFRQTVHSRIIAQLPEIKAWFDEKIKNRFLPFYASFDIRDSSFKVAPVDANVFPAGFNNICDVDRARASLLMGEYLKSHYPKARVILLLAEEHTANFYYWDNIYIIKSLIEKNGYEVRVCVPAVKMQSKETLETASGYEISLSPLEEEKGDLIISNNDFSTDYSLPKQIPCTPLPVMGWKHRRKQDFFSHYNKIAEEFASLIAIEPWHLTVETRLFAPFLVTSRENLQNLQREAEDFLKKLKKNSPAQIKEPPFLFLKNNSGTYGLGITTISSPEEVEHWNYKTRKRMKAAKGGGGIRELIIQEGIPTSLADREGLTAEPVIYMVGSQLAGGFLRSHGRKDEKSNLNSPGSVYKRLCVSDLEIQVKGHVMENVYGWVGRLGLLAVLEEMESLAGP